MLILVSNVRYVKVACRRSSLLLMSNRHASLSSFLGIALRQGKGGLREETHMMAQYGLTGVGVTPVLSLGHGGGSFLANCQSRQYQGTISSKPLYSTFPRNRAGWQRPSSD